MMWRTSIIRSGALLWLGWGLIWMHFVQVRGDIVSNDEDVRSRFGLLECAQSKIEDKLEDRKPGTNLCSTRIDLNVSHKESDNVLKPDEFRGHDMIATTESSQKSRSLTADDASQSFSNATVTIPPSMTFREKLEFFETMFCPGEKSVCGSRNMTVQPFDCSPYWCYQCSCDNCTTHRDCCLDITLQQVEAPSRKSLQPFRSCRTPTPKPGDLVKEDWYLFVDSCPGSYHNDSVRELCEGMNFSAETIGHYFPVYSLTTTENYLNFYCAKCHRDDQSILEWKPDVTCSQYKDMSRAQTLESLFNLIVSGYGCAVTSVPPVVASVTACNGSLRTVRSCNETGSWDVYDEDIVKACRMYKSEVLLETGWYRNIFCAFCNGYKINTALQRFNEEPHFICASEPTDPRELGSSVLAFSFIFNLRPKGEKHVLDSDEMMECEQNQVFDPTKRVCRELICSRGRLLLDHSCVDIYDTTASLRYKVTYVMLPNKIPHLLLTGLVSFFENHTARVGLEMDKSLLETSFTEHSMKACCEFGQSGDQPYIHYVVAEFVALFAEGPMTQREIEISLLQVFNFSWKHEDGSIWTLNVLASDLVNHDNLTCFSHVSKSAIPQSQIGRYLTFKYEPQSLIPLNKLTRCKQIELDKSEYTFKPKTGEITLHGVQVTLDSTEYTRSDGNVRVCVNYSGTYYAQPKPVSGPSEGYTERVLTLFSMAVSLLCLSITFTVSLITNTQASIPGKISVTLVASLFVAQLIYFVSGYLRPLFWPCRIFGFAAHYTWLVVFGWKNIAAYHMYAVFTRPLKKGIVHTNSKTFCLYVIYAFGVPAIVVGSYLLIRILLSESRDIGYGEVVCFLSQPIDVDLAFVAPVCTVLLTNTYFFVHAIHAIRRMSVLDKNSNRSNATHNSLFIKMSLILGFTWIVGFVANIVDEPYLWHVFTVLNGGIGALIFISQVCRKRTLELWKNRRKGRSCLRGAAQANDLEWKVKGSTSMSFSATGGTVALPMNSQ